MFDFQNNPFNNTSRSIPKESQIIFVSDLFVEDYVGGAELTSEALIIASPFSIFKLKSKDVTLDLLKQGADKFWIFGNFVEINPQLVPTILGNLKYTVLEYDYKYCNHRSPEKHLATVGMHCDCHNQHIGKMISSFYLGSMGMWWMSEKQKQKYLTLFPNLSEKNNIVLSSVFDDKTLKKIKTLRQLSQTSRSGWIVLGSNSWVKGAQAAEKWCQENNKQYEIVWNLPYEQMLQKLSRAEGFVYLPEGGDTCPRMVIEAKLLGCKLHINDNVQHKDEEWFVTDDIESIENHLQAASRLFWDGIKKMIDYKPSISGYATTYNCVKQEYPFEQCIRSMLEFCDEVCVVDGGSDDNTIASLAAIAYPHISFAQIIDFEVLSSMFALSNNQNLSCYDFPDVYQGIKKDPRIKIRIVPRDWNHSRSAVFDGAQKAEARNMCTGEYCWQMDVDEVVHEDDVKKIKDLCRAIPKDVHILSLPVIEYWGSDKKIRMDINPAKWRLSRNLSDITHGIPRQLRAYDVEGNLYSLPGSDGCDMVSKETGECLPHVSFFSQEANNARQAALLGNEQARIEYEKWFNAVVLQLPGVHHYSWLNIERKIRLYKDFWTRHWSILQGESYKDSAETNMFFDVPWSEVTDGMIKEKAKELAENTGGHVFHKKYKGERTPYITCNRSQPKAMQNKT